MFIGRRLDRTIYGAWTQAQPDDEFHPGLENVSDDHPDYIAFRDRPRPVFVDPRDAKIAELESRLVTLESR